MAGKGFHDRCADTEFGESLGFDWIRVGGYRVGSVRIRSAIRRGLVNELVVRGAQQNSWVREAPSVRPRWAGEATPTARFDVSRYDHDTGRKRNLPSPGLGGYPGVIMIDGSTPFDSTDAALSDPSYRAALVDLFGVLAYGELVAFERLAADAAMAPRVEDKAALAGMATSEYRHFLSLQDRLSDLGVDPNEAMEPFRQPIDEFHAHTKPADWLEGLVKAYVGDGIGTDFYREISAFVDPASRELVLDVCEDLGQSAFAVDRVRSAIAADPRVAGRLALWGRRLVGEALSQAQRVAADRDALSALLVGGADRPGVDLAEIGRMLARLTDNHTRRMQELGLAA